MVSARLKFWVWLEASRGAPAPAGSISDQNHISERTQHFSFEFCPSVRVRKADIWTVKLAQIIRPAIARVELRCLEWMGLFNGFPTNKTCQQPRSTSNLDVISSVTRIYLNDVLICQVQSWRLICRFQTIFFVFIPCPSSFIEGNRATK
jgi:hypothetical protein